ncbi:hypothetical protein R1flu_025494 [Riccia fluitans]|uniref:Uncharacterized protein n=1 Tax=Riccia fluitans TaxID=41844 RepID=A0ABD1XXX8_9MARC
MVGRGRRHQEAEWNQNFVLNSVFPDQKPSEIAFQQGAVVHVLADNRCAEILRKWRRWILMLYKGFRQHTSHICSVAEKRRDTEKLRFVLVEFLWETVTKPWESAMRIWLHDNDSTQPCSDRAGRLLSFTRPNYTPA